MHYNFARIHQRLRVTPAMAAGVSEHVWETEDIVALPETGRQPARLTGPAAVRKCPGSAGQAKIPQVAGPDAMAEALRHMLAPIAENRD